MASTSGNNLVEVSPEDEQQFYFETFGDADWTSYQLDEHIYLQRNIGFALFRSPTEVDEERDDFDSIIGYKKKETEEIKKLYDIIIENFYLEDPVIVIRTIFICCEMKNKKKIFCEPLFILKKCNKINGCKIYIDKEGRVYKSWALYLKNNRLPECTMYCPKDGKYSGEIIPGTEEVKVTLEIHMSPACSVGMQILKGTDIAGTAISVGTTLTMAAAAVPAITVAPAVLAASAVAGVGVGLYSIGRSIHTLVDRGQHQQSISLDNSESRWCWLNTTVGILGASTTAAAGLMAKLASQGSQVNTAARVAMNTLTVANVTGAGVSIMVSGYTVIQKILNKEQISTLEVFQFASQILFFHQSITNFKTAKTIIAEAQSTALENYASTLRSNRHRKLFRKAQLEARRVKGDVAGNAETIRGIRNINDPDNFFAGLAKINKDLNKNGARYNINAEGKIDINRAHVVDPADFSTISRENRTNVLSKLPAPQQSCALPKPITKQDYNVMSVIVSRCAHEIATQVVHRGSKLLLDAINNELDCQTVVLLLNDICEIPARYMFGILIEFMNDIYNYLEDFKNISPLITPAVGALQFLIGYLREEANYLELDLLQYVKTCFDKNGIVIINFMERLVDAFCKWIESYKNKWRRTVSIANEWAQQTVTRLKCTTCSGSYYTRK